MNKQLEGLARDLAKKYELEEWHMELMNMVMLPKALRPSKAYILGKLNIKEATYYHWLRHPRFNNARREFVKQYYKDDIPDVLLALKDEAVSGNVIAAKLFLEYVDDFNRDEYKRHQDELPPPMQRREAQVIINNLTQKFYGSTQPAIRTIENQTQPEFRGGSLPFKTGVPNETLKMDTDNVGANI